MDATTIIGSFGAAVLSLGGGYDLIKRVMNRRVDRRKADAEAEGLELGNAKALQELLREPFEAMQRDNAELLLRVERAEGATAELREEFQGAKALWQEERIALADRVHELQDESAAAQRKVGALEKTVEALRTQIRAFGQAPAA